MLNSLAFYPHFQLQPIWQILASTLRFYHHIMINYLLTCVGFLVVTIMEHLKDEVPCFQKQVINHSSGPRFSSPGPIYNGIFSLNSLNIDFILYKLSKLLWNVYKVTGKIFMPLLPKATVFRSGQKEKCMNKCSQSVWMWFMLRHVLKSGPEVIKLFSYSTQLSMKFFMLINIKMPTVVGILIFISRKNFMLSSALQEKSLNCWYLTFIGRTNFILSWVEHEKSL